LGADVLVSETVSLQFNNIQGGSLLSCGQQKQLQTCVGHLRALYTVVVPCSGYSETTRTKACADAGNNQCMNTT